MEGICVITVGRASLFVGFGRFTVRRHRTVSFNRLFVAVVRVLAEACALVSLHRSDTLFGAERDAKRAAVDQGEDIARFVSGGMPTQYAAAWRRFGRKDSVVMVP